MKKIKNKILPLFLAALMVITAVPAFAGTSYSIAFDSDVISCDAAEAEAGEVIEFSVIYEDGYYVEEVSVTADSGETVDVEDGYSFTMPSDNVTVSAVIYKEYYSITSDSDMVEVSDTASYGDTVQITVNEEDGYVLTALIVSSEDGEEIEVSDGYVFTMPASDVTVSAVFNDVQSPVFSDISYSSEWTNGSVEITGSVSDNSGDVPSVVLDIDGEETEADISEDGSFSVTASKEGDTYTLIASDASENSAKEKLDINIDKTAPVVSIDTTYTSGRWITGYAGLTIDAEETGSGIYAVYCDGEEITATSDGSYTYIVDEDTNRDYTFYAVDNAGNTSEEVSIIIRIDRTPPEITNITLTETLTTTQKLINFLTFGVFYNDSVTLTVTAEDTGSGLGYAELYADGELLDTVSFTDGSNAVFIIDEDYFEAELSVVVYDALANESEAFYLSDISDTIENDTLMIEKAAPTISIDCDTVYGGWSDGDVDFTVYASDADSGLNEVTAYINDVEIKSYSFSDTYTTEYNFTVSTAEAKTASDGKYVLEVTAADNSQNEKTVMRTVYVDTSDPYIVSFEFDTESGEPVSSDDTYGYYFNSDTAVTITAADDSPSSGLSTITYFTVSDGGESSAVTAAVDDNGQISFTLEADFKGWIYARATDNVGNTASAVNADGVILESASKHADTSSITFSVNTVKDYYDDDVDVTVAVSDTYSGIASIGWSVSGADDPDNDQSGDMSVFSVTDTDSNLATGAEGIITATNDSNDIVLSVTLTDNAGNKTTKTYTLNIDKTDPVVSVSYDNNDVDSSSYYKAKRTITVTVVERNFDASLVSIDGFSVSAWTYAGNDTYKATYTFGEGDHDISIYVKDLAGNKSGTTSDSFTIDLTAPKVTVTYDNNSSQNGYYYDASRTATITVVETNFDASRVTVEGGSASSWKTSGNTHTATVSFTSDGTYTFDVTVTDKAGNTYDSYSADTFVIDTKSPIMALSYDTYDASNLSYYNTVRTATITVVDVNFASLELIGTYGTIVSKTTSGYKTIYTIRFDQDGDYSFTFAATDKAGNTTTYRSTQSFTIDLTDPIMSVTYDGSSSVIDEVSNTSHTATVTIIEHNFDSSGFTVSGASLSGWESSGDVHTATMTFTGEGTYQFTLGYTDLAGNAADSYTSIEFIIDKTAPEISFFDVEDSTAYRSSLEPGIICTDDNYDYAGVTITLEGYYHDAVTVTGTNTLIVNGESIKLSDIEHTEDNDDVYTITVTATDLAGNTSTASITFSLNRYGSNFILSDDSQDYVDAYYHNTEAAITIIEINVDEVSSSSAYITADGVVTALTENEDYGVQSFTSGWNYYEYTFPASLFSEEALYDITISTIDEAGNTQSNKSKECPAVFVIDKTDPSAIISAIEDGGIYDSTERSFEVILSDNVALYKCELYVNGELAAEYEGEELSEIDYRVSYTLTEDTSWQTVSATVIDAAGNEYETDEIEVLVSTNFFNRLVKSSFFPWLLALLIFLLLLLLFLILWKKRKKDK